MLKTIAEHQTEMTEWYQAIKESELKTGVRCPKCTDAVELLKDDPFNVLASISMMPPQAAVHCPRCGFKTTIFA